jgi:hypothetical protein
MLLKRQPRAPEPFLKIVGVSGIGEAKGYKKILCLITSAPTPRLNATLAVEGQHVAAHGTGYALCRLAPSRHSHRSLR